MNVEAAWTAKRSKTGCRLNGKSTLSCQRTMSPRKADRHLTGAFGVEHLRINAREARPAQDHNGAGGLSAVAPLQAECLNQRIGLSSYSGDQAGTDRAVDQALEDRRLRTRADRHQFLRFSRRLLGVARQ